MHKSKERQPRACSREGVLFDLYSATARDRVAYGHEVHCLERSEEATARDRVAYAHEVALSTRINLDTHLFPMVQ